MPLADPSTRRIITIALTREAGANLDAICAAEQRTKRAVVERALEMYRLAVAPDARLAARGLPTVKRN